MPNHDHEIFNGEIWAGHNGDSEWQTVSLKPFVNKKSQVRLIIEILSAEGAGVDESVFLYARETGGNFKSRNEIHYINYSGGEREEITLYTSDDCKIDYKLEYGQPEEKKITVKLTLDCSIEI